MNRFIFLVFVVLIFIQCREPYSFDTNPQEGLLIVDGGISDLPGPYYITLSTTTSTQRKPIPVTAAIVYVSDDQGNIEYFSEGYFGKYTLAGNVIRAQAGIKYTLHIKTQDSRSYESTEEALPDLETSSDSLYTTVLQETFLNGSNNVEYTSWRVNTKLNIQLPASPAEGYYRWSLQEVYSVLPMCLPGAISCPPICYVTESNGYNLYLIDPKNYAGSKINNLLLQDREIDFSFDTRHYFIATQYVINKNAYNYWIKIQDLITRKGSIFDTPPYTIRGNISNQGDANEVVFGYFEVTKQKNSRVHIDRMVIPTHVSSCQFYSPDFDYPYNNIPSFCFSCLVLDGSTTTEPDWFW